MTPTQTMPSSAASSSIKDWFTLERLGMFIHFGLYSLPARSSDNGLAEWIRHNEGLTGEHYKRYFEHFNPDLFNPREWARTARAAGMRYAVMTAKHHDGFCLWDSSLTDYKAPNTPFGRDLIREYVDAFRAEGLKVGFYYSLFDWHHPDFPLDGLHPQAGDLEFRSGHSGGSMERYREYLFGQVRELLTQYGEISLLWFDFSYPKRDWGWSQGKGRSDWHSERLLEQIRTLQPGILVNNRLDTHGNFITPEQVQPLSWPLEDGERVTWEACQTLNGTWGYDRNNAEWKSTDLILRLLVDTVSKGGNLLLNVGPNARGAFPPETEVRLREVGEWTRLHARAIYGCTQSEFSAPPDARLTQNGHRLYLHLFSYPLKQTFIPGLAGRVKYAQFLHDASEVVFRDSRAPEADNHQQTDLPPGSVVLELPPRKPEVAVVVIELFLN